jgi:hypothetical protein
VSSEPVHESEHVLTKADLATVEALRPGTALLVVVRGPNNGPGSCSTTTRSTSGRHPESDIFLDDVTVSRRHAIFVGDARRGIVVKDVGSLNGTYVNRELVEAAVLTTGDEVQIGKYRFVYYASQADPPVAAVGCPSPGLSIGAVVRTTSADEFPRPDDLQAPLPRGRGSGHARAHGIGLPEVYTDERRGAVALRPDRPSVTGSGRCASSSDNLDALDRGLTPATGHVGGPAARRADLPADPDVPERLGARRGPRRCASPRRSWPGPPGWRRRPSFRPRGFHGLLRPGRRRAARRRGPRGRPCGRRSAGGIRRRGLVTCGPFRTAAEREVGLVEQIVVGSARRGQDATRSLPRSCTTA